MANCLIFQSWILILLISSLVWDHSVFLALSERWPFRKDPLYEPLTRYVKLRVAHAPGMPGTFSPPPRVSYPDRHHCTCVMHVPWCIPGTLTSGFLWSRWRGKRSRHPRCMRNPQFYISGKRRMSVVPQDLPMSRWWHGDRELHGQWSWLRHGRARMSWQASKYFLSI